MPAGEGAGILLDPATAAALAGSMSCVCGAASTTGSRRSGPAWTSSACRPSCWAAGHGFIIVQ